MIQISMAPLYNSSTRLALCVFVGTRLWPCEARSFSPQPVRPVLPPRIDATFYLHSGPHPTDQQPAQSILQPPTTSNCVYWDCKFFEPSLHSSSRSPPINCFNILSLKVTAF
eukprot:Gb_11924 [translate_table: standard]